MANKRITDLTPVEGIPNPGDVLMIVDSVGKASKIKISQISGYAEEVIIKCQNCGQWGAKKTACKHCGGPVG